MMADNIEERNTGSEGTINKEELHKAINILKSEEEAGNERNIDNILRKMIISCPGKIKMQQQSTTR